ncbi:hypothetical protein A5672_26645 [Mycobacterium alsense]|uniref:Transmembrane protein n=1 Tax=Mycobacterium alsense TaxID=324058 RepID=A0ABD6NYX5_9MYCO|nr:hypothetical protein A5672_26645 [Mycobacterium alsense]OBI94591.1 hypothetical protein A5660_11705 [Mycobacterium alsense]
MHNRRILLGVAGLVLALVGLAALWFPVALDQHDAYGFPIECGNGFTADVPQLAGGQVADRCESALLMRRAWAIPSTAIGWLLVSAFLIAWTREAPSARADAS